MIDAIAANFLIGKLAATELRMLVSRNESNFATFFPFFVVEEKMLNRNFKKLIFFTFCSKLIICVYVKQSKNNNLCRDVFKPSPHLR